MRDHLWRRELLYGISLGIAISIVPSACAAPETPKLAATSIPPTAPLLSDTLSPTEILEPTATLVPPTEETIPSLADQMADLGWIAEGLGLYTFGFYSALAEDEAITFTVCPDGPTSVSDIFAIIGPVLVHWGMPNDVIQEFQDGMNQRAETGTGGLGSLGDYLVAAGTSDQGCLVMSVLG